MLWLPVSSANAQTAAELDPSQTYATGNLVVPTTTTSGSTWTNGVYQDALTCWGGGQPGYCGPNPIVRPDGSINYSYGWVDLYQQQLIANVLPYSGTGLRVNGYNFNFMAKNGNGWDDGRTDLLYAYVQFDGPSGTILNNTANLSYQFNWSRITLDQTFATPYATTDITSVRYGFVGQDNNFWAGPYGPEIYDVNFSLRYSVDPCVSDPLYSPTCPGYLAALAALIPATDPISEVTASAASSNTADTAGDPGASPTVAAATTASAAASSEAPAPAATEQRSESTSERRAGASLSTILGIVGREQSRITALEQNTVAESVGSSLREAERTASEAEAVAQSSSSQSQEQAQGQDAASASANTGAAEITAITASTVSTASLIARSGPATVVTDMTIDSVNTAATDMTQTPTTMSAATEVSMPTAAGAVELRVPGPGSANMEVNAADPVVVDMPLGRGLVIELPAQPVIVSVESVIAAPRMESATTAPVVSEVTATQPQFLFRVQPQAEIDLPVMTTVPVGMSTPADDFLEPRAPVIDSSTQGDTSTVRKSSATNDLAMGTDITAMAQQPPGYAQYSVALQDAVFYAPREIYRGQKVIDNARALRQLSSDARHQEMVEQQYKR